MKEKGNARGPTRLNGVLGKTFLTRAGFNVIVRSLIARVVPLHIASTKLNACAYDALSPRDIASLPRSRSEN